jgi:ATP-dependent protease HslVU (ClpYQ) peptidase subunit
LKAQAQREEYLKKMRRLKDASLLQTMFGQTRDVLVLRFIEKLRSTVQNKKDDATKAASQDFIRSILKKKVFNDQFKVMKEKKKKSI